MFSNEREAHQTIEQHYRGNFKELVRKLTPKCRGYHNAEDIVQDTYTKSLRYWKAFDADEGDFQSWFNKILTNCASSHMTKEKLHGAVGEEHMFLVPDDTQNHSGLPRLELRDVLMLIRMKRSPTREILHEALIDQAPHQKIADRYELNYRAIERAVDRFRQLLKSL